jgi:soluble calcium-activated nucleotidase 1
MRPCRFLLNAIFAVCSLRAAALGRENKAVQTSPVLDPEGQLEFLIVADLDHASRVEDKLSWRSTLRRGALVRDTSTGNFTLSWTGRGDVRSSIARKGRGMELSTLAAFRGGLWSACDYTGILYRLLPSADPEGGEGWNTPTAVPTRVLVDGPELGSPEYFGATKGMKAEWSTVKDGEMLVGSIGKEWIDSASGAVLHRGPEWVKIISAEGGAVRAVDWGPRFAAMRSATGTEYPEGYLWHEAVLWHPEGRRWVVAPRKASANVPYSPEADQTKGTNLLLVANEDFSEIRVLRLGPEEPRYGFTALRQLPGIFSPAASAVPRPSAIDGSDAERTVAAIDATDAPRHLFAALKVKEVELASGEVSTHTKLAVFDLEGRFYTDPPFLHVSEDKYEGIEFLTGVTR